MCYNCGCGELNNDHGHSGNITGKTFIDAAASENQSVEDAKKNTLELLEEELNVKKNHG